MDKRAVLLDDEAIDQLCHANYLEFSRELARWSGRRGEIEERDGVLLMATSSSFPVSCNGIARLDPTRSADDVIDIADAWFAARDRGYSVTTSDVDDGDRDLVTVAESRGLLEVLSSPAMVCTERLADARAPKGVDLRWLDQSATVSDFIAVNDSAYQALGMPGGVIHEMVTDYEAVVAPHIQTVVAYDGDRPISTAQILLSHGVAGVYYVGTVESARGRGLAELVTRAVTNRAFDLGARFVTLQASSMGEPIYRRMGYVERYRYTTHTRFA